MALANFFDKASLAVSQILQGYDKADFEKKLNAVTVEIAFDREAVSSPEGLFTLDLTIRLLARLYSNIHINPLDASAKNHKEKLEELAKSINPDISLIENVAFVSIIVGNSPVSRDGLVFYAGSNEWVVSFSQSRPVGSGKSSNPFGAGAAACFSAANLFRAIFKDQLVNGDLDNDFSLSLFSFQRPNSEGSISLANISIDFDETFLVGLGAIGNGALWALSKLNNAKGCVHIIDPEKLDISNLQRYILATQDDVNEDKIRLCNRYGMSGLFIPFKGTWVEFLTNRQNWNLPLVALAVDSAEDRIAVQSSLPNIILNAWTQPSDLGISRHCNFLEQPCVACLYPPKSGLQSKSQLIAGALGLPEKETLIREIIYNNSPLDENWIKEISEAKGVPFNELESFIGMPISVFYTKALCGGIITTNNHNQQMETPMAFQSALAGILLASELVLHVCGMRKNNIEIMTRINLLKPLAQYLNEPLVKNQNATCICSDEDFRLAYNTKYLK